MTIRVATRRVFRIVNGGTPTSESSNWDGDVPWATPVDLGIAHGGTLGKTKRTLTPIGLSSGSRSVPAGSLVLSTRAPIGYVAIADRDMAFNQGCRGLVPIVDVDVRFVRYQLEARASELQALGVGSTFMELSTEALGSFPLRIPGLDEQRAIADFLEHETVRIDDLIAKKQRLRSVLEEHEQAVLMRFLGDWRVESTVSLRQLGTFVLTGPFGTQLAASEYVEGGVPVINPTHITDGGLVPEPHVTLPPEVALRLVRHRLQRGDIVLGRKGDVGRSALILERHEGWICGSDSIAIRTDGRRLLPRFLARVLQSQYYRQQLASHSTGATMLNVNESVLLGFSIPALDSDTQSAIVREIDRALARHNEVRVRLDRQLALLREHRQALITATVAGELEVPGVAA